jgi:geranylgeranyl diphosphate synthase type II
MKNTESDDSAFGALLAPYLSLIEPELKRIVSALDSGQARGLADSIGYSLLAPGKRLRPVLAMISAELAGGRKEQVIGAACALEMIHAASLILDDLPSMDNAILRRGRQTLHLFADESGAILAAECLLMEALGLVASNAAARRLKSAEIAEIVNLSAGCVGIRGMSAGQWCDLHPQGADLDTLEYIHSRKTGSLFILSCTLGARLCRADSNPVAMLAASGKNLGLAYQIIDDVLDIESTSAKLGKDAQNDRGKVTFTGLIGVEHSRQIANELVETALESIKPLGVRAGILIRLAEFVTSRDK